MQRACGTFTPSKWTKHKCAVCFFSDKDHTGGFGGTSDPGASPNEYGHPAPSTDSCGDASLTRRKVPSTPTLALAPVAVGRAPSSGRRRDSASSQAAAAAAAASVQASAGGAGQEEEAPHLLKPSALRANPRAYLHLEGRTAPPRAGSEEEEEGGPGQISPVRARASALNQLPLWRQKLLKLAGSEPKSEEGGGVESPLYPPGGPDEETEVLPVEERSLSPSLPASVLLGHGTLSPPPLVVDAEVVNGGSASLSLEEERQRRISEARKRVQERKLKELEKGRSEPRAGTELRAEDDGGMLSPRSQAEAEQRRAEAEAEAMRRAAELVQVQLEAERAAKEQEREHKERERNDKVEKAKMKQQQREGAKQQQELKRREEEETRRNLVKLQREEAERKRREREEQRLREAEEQRLRAEEERRRRDEEERREREREEKRREREEAAAAEGAANKEWNGEFQELEELEEDDQYKYSALAALVKDFASVASVYAKVIISERFLPVQTVPPLSPGSPKYRAHGLDFELYLDAVQGLDVEGEPHYRYGHTQPDHARALRAAHRALAAHEALYHARGPGLCVPLVTLVTFRGYGCLVSAQLPPLTLVWRAEGEGDPSVAEQVRAVLRRLQLSAPPAELEVGRGSDGRLYLQHWERLLPEELPGAPVRARLLALLAHPVPASLVAPAAAALVPEQLARLAQDLVARPPPDLRRLVRAVHERGLALRHLGQLRPLLPEQARARTLVLTECVARAVKNLARHELRESLRVYRSTSEEPYRRCVFLALKGALSYQTPAPTYFERPESAPSGLHVDLPLRLVTREEREPSEAVLVSLEANYSLPIPWRQKSFYMELRLESDAAQAQLLFGLCGTATHNVLQDVTGYCYGADAEGQHFWVQGKPHAAPFALRRGDVLGLFYAWRGRQLLFTLNGHVRFTVAIAKGAYIPKLALGERTRVQYNFGPNFQCDVEALAESLGLEGAIVEDEAAVFWAHDVKDALSRAFPGLLAEHEQPAHVSLRSLVDLPALARRLEELTGVVLTERVHAYLAEDPVAPFTLAPWDVVRLEGTLTTLNAADFALGVVQLLEATQRGLKLDKDKEGAALLAAAHEALEGAHAALPLPSPAHALYLGRYHHWAAHLALLEAHAQRGAPGHALLPAVERHQARALTLYEEARTLAPAHAGRRHAALAALYRAMLLAETGRQAEALPLLAEQRAAGEDAQLVAQLEGARRELVRVASAEHAHRLLAVARVMGQAFAAPPLDLEAVLLAAHVQLLGLRALLMLAAAEAWEERLDADLEPLSTLLARVAAEDAPRLAAFLATLLHADEAADGGTAQGLVDHHLLVLLLRLAARHEPLRPLLAPSLPRTPERVVHPSVLLRRLVHEHGALFPRETEAHLRALVAHVVETRLVNQWRRAKPSADQATPPPLHGATLTWLPAQGRLYLFGGTDGQQRLGRLFAFDVAQGRWAELESSAPPPPRQDHAAMAVRLPGLAHEVLLVWGGRGAHGYLDDAHAFDPTTRTWQPLPLPGEGPSARAGFSVCRVGHELWFLGGKQQGGTCSFQELHVLDLKELRWERRAAWGELPAADYNFTTACADGEVIWKFGGEVGGNDLYALHTSSLRWYKCNVGGRYPGYEAAQDSLSYAQVRDKLVMFGLESDVYALHLGVIPKGLPLYARAFDPMGSDLAHAQWHECDSSYFPTEERKAFAACAVGTTLYSHGGCDPDGRPLDSTWAYNLENNTWERLDLDSDDPVPELYGHSMTFYGNKLYLFGGIRDLGHASNILYVIDLATAEWRALPVTYRHSEGRTDLLPRAFHAAIVQDNLLYLWGGQTELSQSLVETPLMQRQLCLLVSSHVFGAMRVIPSLAIACLFSVELLLRKSASLSLMPMFLTFVRSPPTVRLISPATITWSRVSLRGEPPSACEGCNLVAHGKYVLKYGGHAGSTSFGQLAILNAESLVWEAEIDLQVEPIPGHSAHLIEDKLFVIEQGFEMSYLDVDACDRLGLFRTLHTYGKRHRGKRAAVALVGESRVYAYGGITREGISSTFSHIDLEVDCYRDEEKELANLPAFLSLNRHIMVLAVEARDLPARPDGEASDPYVVAKDPEWFFDPQRSPVAKATLSPNWSHEFYFYNVEGRGDPKVALEVRDAKDDLLYGRAVVGVKVFLKMCSKPRSPAFYEKWFKLVSVEDDVSGLNASGEMRLRIVGF